MTERRLSFPRFREFRSSDLRWDLHLHTTRTDGEAEVAAVLREAERRGLRRIAFTEHVRRDSAWFPEFAGEVRAKARGYPGLEVLVGCEAKALDTSGSLDASPSILAECDVVLGSVHRFPDGRGGFLAYSAFAPRELAEAEFELARGLLRSDHVDVLAHPGGMYARRLAADLPEDLLRELFRESIERGKAIEINASYLQAPERFLRLLEEINPHVSVGSDMHRLEDLGRCQELLAGTRTPPGPEHDRR